MAGSSEIGSASVILGRIHGADASVYWSVNIAGNPHLMIAGLPGMGKTTCLVNLCRQLQSFGITPIVFSYHDDIDSKLAEFYPDIGKSDCQSLGFNPMRVADQGPLGHIESAGLLRDIFASIFPELGNCNWKLSATQSSPVTKLTDGAHKATVNLSNHPPSVLSLRSCSPQGRLIFGRKRWWRV
jgi:hypothetical protein